MRSSYSPLLTRIAIVLLAILSFHCADTDSQVCGNGLVCPQGTRCAGADTVCIRSQCGDLELDPGEVCDDGNLRDGDGCSSDCTSDETCGNNVTDVDIDLPEVCDD